MNQPSSSTLRARLKKSRASRGGVASPEPTEPILHEDSRGRPMNDPRTWIHTSETRTVRVLVLFANAQSFDIHRNFWIVLLYGYLDFYSEYRWCVLSKFQEFRKFNCLDYIFSRAIIIACFSRDADRSVSHRREHSFDFWNSGLFYCCYNLPPVGGVWSAWIGEIVICEVCSADVLKKIRLDFPGYFFSCSSKIDHSIQQAADYERMDEWVKWNYYLRCIIQYEWKKIAFEKSFNSAQNNGI